MFYCTTYARSFDFREAIIWAFLKMIPIAKLSYIGTLLWDGFYAIKVFLFENVGHRKLMLKLCDIII